MPMRSLCARHAIMYLRLGFGCGSGGIGMISNRGLQAGVWFAWVALRCQAEMDIDAPGHTLELGVCLIRMMTPYNRDHARLYTLIVMQG